MSAERQFSRLSQMLLSYRAFAQALAFHLWRATFGTDMQFAYYERQ